jgi:hypothetical protein
LDVERVVMIHPYWDMALLKVRGLTGDRPPLALGIGDPAEMAGRDIVVIGYPGYDPWGDAEFQRIQDRVFRSTYYVKRMQPGLLRLRQPVESFGRQVHAITHDSSTLGGNSGSVVVMLPRTGENPGPEGLHVVGLHFAGQYLVANYAVPSMDLAQDSRIVDAGLNFVGRVEPRSDFYGPYWREVDTERAPSVRTPSPLAPPAASALMTDGEVSVTIGRTVTRVVTTATVEPQRVPIEGIFGGQPLVATSDLPYPFSAASLEAMHFDWNTALSLALASRLAYENPSAILTTARDMWQLEGCKFIEADDTQCFVATTPQTLLLAFRGTESAGDWLADLDIASKARPYGVVHRGFLVAFQAVERQLLTALEASPDRFLVLTGHSLGGALATVAAAEWHQRFKVRWVMTFGQPAVGRRDFEQHMKQYGGSFIRFVNNDDVIARVPPTYRHVGHVIHFDASDNVAAGTESPNLYGEWMLTEAEFDALRAALLQQRAERRTMGQELPKAPGTEGLLPSLSDHGLDAYISKITKHTPLELPLGPASQDGSV